MSTEIPVFSFHVPRSQVDPKTLTYAQAFYLVPDEHWRATSRNWWYQYLLQDLLAVYPGFEKLGYLLKKLVLVEPDQSGPLAGLIRALLQAIRTQPEGFVSLKGGQPEEVCNSIDQASVLRCLDDDCGFAFGNFFSYLLSQAAALDEAQVSGRALIHLQPQPDPPDDSPCASV